MRIGHVTANGRVHVQTSVKAASGKVREVGALLDTGFNGALALPPEEIAALGLKRRSKTTVVLASGERRHVPTYRATIQFGGQEQAVLVAEAGEPLIGMSLLWGYDLQVQCRANGSVAVEAHSARG